MARIVTSKTMGSVSELTLIADLRPELVEIRPTLTHATRLRILLRTLYGIRRAAVEETTGPRLRGPLEALEFLHFVRFALLDRDTKLLLAVTFDGAWEPYIRAIAEQGGPLLDAILCHCEGYNAHASDRGYAAFGDWARRHQVEADFFFADSPGTTARDVRLLRRFHEQQTGGGPITPGEPDPSPEDVLRGLKALHQLHDLDRLFPDARENLFVRRTAKMVLASVESAIGTHLDRLAAAGHGQDRPHRSAFRWVTKTSFPTPPALSDPATRPEPAGDVQGNVLSPYADRTHGVTLFFRIADLERAKRFLAELPITGDGETPSGPTCNLGLTERGLRRLGVEDHELERLPQEFREGMAARAGWLGDLGPNHPSHWRLPRRIQRLEDPPGELRVRLSTVDFVIQIQACVEEDRPGDHVFDVRHPLFAHVRDHFGDAEATGVRLLAVEAQRSLGAAETAGRSWGMEHFGYLDGLSQPSIDAAVPERDRVSLGELVLGYGDDRDGVATETPLPWMRNGSFWALRKLRQNVAAFRKILHEHRATHPDLAERLMGRPLAPDDPVSQARDADELRALLDHDYEAGSPRAHVPADSHVRRANPRTGPDGAARVRAREGRAVPRIARRGMSYGAAYVDDSAAEEQGGRLAGDDDDRGLLFTCYNASLADQFEVIQRWLSGANASGVVGLRNDPFLGVPEPGRRKVFTLFDADGRPEGHVDLGAEPLVRLEWGLYLFAPSRSGLRALATRDLRDHARRDRASDADVEAGEAVIGRMEEGLAIERARDPDRAHFKMAMRWKALIEDPSARETMRQVWAAIRARGGALDTPYGVLVGSRAEIGRIFAHPKDYSVSEYWNRMRRSIGEHYLGMDPSPEPMAEHANPVARATQDRFLAAVDRDRYAREAEIANAWIASIDAATAFGLAHRVAGGVIEALIELAAPIRGGPRPPSDATVVNAADLVQYTVGRMSMAWFNLPDPEMTWMVTGRPAPGPHDPPGLPHNPDNFLSTARQIFSPNPTDFVRRDGEAKGRALLDGARGFVDAVLSPTDAAVALPGSMLETLIARRDEIETAGVASEGFADFCARTLLGTIHGFVGPVGGSATSLLHEWIENRDLWRWQQALLEAVPDPMAPLDWATAEAVLLDGVRDGMRLQPFPYVLHRTPVRDVTLRLRPRPRGRRPGEPSPLERDLTVEAGRRIVLGIVSGAHDATDWTGPDDMPVDDLLFGGAYGARRGAYGARRGAYGPDGTRKTGLHACPGRAIGIGTIVGLLAALMQSGNLRRLAPRKLELAPFEARRRVLTPKPSKPRRPSKPPKPRRPTPSSSG